MKKSVYKSAMDRVKTSEAFQEETCRKLTAAAASAEEIKSNPAKERMNMEASKKRTIAGWSVGLAACAALSASLFLMNPSAPEPAPKPQASAGVGTKPPVMGKVAVNIDGVITEVSADGKSFKVGDLWVSVTEQTRLGSPEPTAAEPSEELLQKEFKVGNVVSGYTSQDVAGGKVTADVIYNNMAPAN
ncbi:hypothetical protein NYE40_23580 [Paenibacillus sp. FSL W8-1187]|uniref:hypothetical protein n=1 Tax=Paenibacillus sp. FSL W8-1187 TaxID=2975339 RepID=UPI0030D73188